MPSRKILSILIICIAIVASVAIWQWQTNIKIATINSPSIVSDDSTSGTNSNLTTWQSVLSNINASTTMLSDSSSTELDDNNLTDQIAKNYFGQYLTLQQTGTDITDDNANQIAQNTISSSDFTAPQATVYTASDLKNIVADVSTSTVIDYNNALAASAKNRSVKNYQSELDILNNAMQSGSDADLAKLDPIILAYKGIMSDMLVMKVPANAINLHLETLNDESNMLANIEGMRQIFTDPVRSLAAIKQYQDDYVNLGMAFQKYNDYFSFYIKNNLQEIILK